MRYYDYYKQPPNPTDEQRHVLLKEGLEEAGRPEDYKNVIGLLSPPPDILNYAHSGEFKGIKIGIIGGGLAGMSAAFELRKLGYDITVFDASEDRIGGRAYTYYFDEDKKVYGELGALRIPVSHETTWYYINLFKLGTEPFIQNNPNAFVYVHNTRIKNTPKDIEEKLYPKYNLTDLERRTPWRQLNDYAFDYNMKILPPHIRCEILNILPRYSPSYNTLTNISIRENLEMVGLSPDAINLISSVNLFTGSVIDLSYSDLLSTSYPVNFSYLYRVSGGTSNLPLAFYQSLTSNHPNEYNSIPDNDLGTVTWKKGNWVTGIYKNKNQKQVLIRYSNKNLADSALEAFDYVVCAIPFSVLSTVEIDPFFSNRKMQAIREINYTNGQRTLLLCNKRFWEENTDYGRINGGISFTDLPIVNIIYPSDHVVDNGSPDEPGVLIGSYNLNQLATFVGNMEPNIRIEYIKKQIEKIHRLPEKYLDSIAIQSKFIEWNREYWFRGAVSNFTPEQKRIFSYDILKPEYDNRVFFAGEHTSSTHAWMQGALYTGKLAANKIAYATKSMYFK